MTEARFAWWGALKHGGLLIAPSRLTEYFPDEPKLLPAYLVERLRRALTRLESGAANAGGELLDTVLEQVCGLGVRWEKGAHVNTRWSHRALTGEIVKPQRMWYGPHGASLPVFVSDDTRLGIGRGRRMVSRVVEWLRRSGLKVALLTNARQWRLIHAGLDFEAFAEWDTALWFEEGQPGPQVTALQVLLSPQSLSPPQADTTAPLLAAIQASRRGQAELSAELGERVRLAVELLIQTHGPALEVQGGRVSLRDVYLAAARIIMRMVIVLFAEARDLLPRDNPIYHGSYGLQGLRELLDRFSGGAALERLRHRFGAWPRILALFRLVYEGSHHEALPTRRYGGALFVPGDPDASDPVLRALAVFEDMDHNHTPSDAVVHQVLSLLCRSRVKVGQGRGSIWVEAPVDFSDLSSEYIGILYEGLLDYELRRAEAGDPIVFLALGDEPALPLSRLESMGDSALSNLVEKLKVKKQIVTSGEAEAEEESEEAEAEESEQEDEEPQDESDGEEGDVPTEPVNDGDARRQARERAGAWARKAVIAGKLVAKPRSRSPETVRAYDDAVVRAADGLIARVILAGEWFLVRWGGTRKGAGTFYTRPQLAVPTVQRTLRPLAYDPPLGSDGKPDEEHPTSEWVSKRPEQILALKVCDPAVGSGSFLVASLRFLTDALFISLHHHGRICVQGDEALVTLAEGKLSEGKLVEEHLPCRPDADDFEPRLRARLKRYVVERCLYGVDLDPLAIELARLSLWIETMDKDLPFEFLDHKLKVGNALVGCWFDRFRDYPVLAWDREGGDKHHTTGAHFEKDAWTKAIRQYRSGRIKSELVAWITGQRSLLDEMEGRPPEAVHDEAMASLEAMHALPVHETEERARHYRERILTNPALARLKMAFHTWCAIWFWPPDRLDDAPTPRTFENPSEASREIIGKLTGEHGFFHWELEYPDVFAAPGGGFDALVGNPPWEIQKPNSKEFFSNLEPLYRTYGKQEALAKQKELFAAKTEDERAWLEYSARFKALGNFGKHAASPFGDGADGGETVSFGKGSDAIHRTWQERRIKRSRGYADTAHPFRHQGSADINTYKLFLEQSHALLRPGGYLGMIVPSGVYTDKGSTALRGLFLNRCRWRWLFGFENREGIFDIHRSFKFCPIIVEKGGATERIQTAFMRRSLEDWEQAEEHAISYARAQVERFSPTTRAILEIRSKQDLRVLEKIYAHSVLLGDQGPGGWGIKYATEFHMTNDSKLFPPRPVWEEKGYRPDEYGRWIGPDGDIALPLYQGVMIWQFDAAASEYLQGANAQAKWATRLNYSKALPGSQYMARRAGISESFPASTQFRLGFRAVQNAANQRTLIATIVPACPCGNSVAILRTQTIEDALTLLPLLCSFPVDWVLRRKMSQGNVNWFYVEELPLTRLGQVCPKVCDHLILTAASLSLTLDVFAPCWLRLARHWPNLCTRSLRKLIAVTTHERLRLRCLLDAIAAELYDLKWDDFAWLLRDCDFPLEQMLDKAFTRSLDTKGFWRVDKEKEPELRHTVLTLVAFKDLKDLIALHRGERDKGIEAFCTQHDGDGWMLPESLRLDDYGLGHDRRAKEPQPVRSRMGERFLPWQLEQSVEESWAECERHARNILGEAGFAQLQAELRGERVGTKRAAALGVSEPGVLYGDDHRTPRLFPDETPAGAPLGESRRKGRRR